MSPSADGVVLCLAGRPARCFVPVLGPGVHALQGFFASPRLEFDGGKNTLRYSSGLVSGVPTALITSGAQPCIPAAPRGADEARTSLRTMAGRTSAISCAT